MRAAGRTMCTVFFVLFAVTTLFLPHANATTPKVAAGGYHTMGVAYDGTVVAVGYNYDGQSDLESWTDITQVAA